ncbi:MAG: hypothetical protein ACFCA4_12420 [Cyanophyceae cyanobacterium]
MALLLGWGLADLQDGDRGRRFRLATREAQAIAVALELPIEHAGH